MTEQIERDYGRIYGEGGWIDLPHVRRFSLYGADRLEWLQGQISQDVRALSADHALGYCLCTPTGQIQAFGDIWLEEGAVVLTLPAACADALVQRVEDLVIMEDVELREDPALQGYRFYGSQKPDREAIQIRPGVWEIWTSESIQSILSPQAIKIAELEAGVPQWGRDVTPKTLPPELGPAFVNRYVSLSKGCYVGQEVLMRIDSRGHTNRTWVGLLYENAVPDALYSPRLGHIGSAWVRNEQAVDGLKLAVAGGEAEVRLMPLLR